MSEYMEKHAVSRLIGAPPGYVGYEEGGLLIDAVRKSPHAVLLLDEIEKAHPDMYSILLQVMDHATLTDSHGRKADFRHVILIMTTNAGARDVSDRRLGFADTGQGGSTRGVLERTFTPEFRNRLDATVTFSALGTAEVERVVDKQVDELRALVAAKAVTIVLDPVGASVAGAEGLRPRVRGAADGAADRPRGEEAVVGSVAVRLVGSAGARFASRSRTARSCLSRMAPVALSTPRRDYPGTPLLEDGAGADPLALFMAWFHAAELVEADATAMVLATAGRDGQPSARLVLLKELDARGLTFFTSYESRKGEELAANDRASLLFYWRSLDRQVRVEGRVARITGAESDAYFESRPLESRWSAVRLAAKPSDRQPRGSSRSAWTRCAANSATPCRGRRRGADIAWRPHAYEFWQGRPNRLHDRLRYERHEGSWRRERLAP